MHALRLPFLFRGRFLMLAALVLLGLAGPACAQIDQSVNQTVWQMLYGVTADQLNDPAWLARDDDGDGISNGAEIAAGTNPFSAGSSIKISSITADATNVYLSFPTVTGKLYTVETSGSLGSSAVWSTLSPSVQTMGNGAVLSLTVPNGSSGSSQFFHVLVQDVDTDGDGVSDWAEKTIGYNPSMAATTAGVGDHSAILSALAAENQVSVVPVKATATQPPDSSTPATDLATVTVTRSGKLHFNTVTVNLAKAGSAVEGVDYSSLPATVTFAPRVSSITLTVVPRATSAPTLKTNATAIVKVTSGSGYTMGGANSATVTINPAAATNGTGLTGNYQNTSNATYSAQTAIFSSAPEMTRVDPVIDFATGVNGWGAVGGPVGMSSPSTTSNAFSIRWTGQVQPQYSEPYTFDFRSDDGAKVWVNGVLLIDKWAGQSVTDNTNTITLQGGMLYDIVIEYLNVSGNAEAHLYWWSPSQVKQIIPQGRLYPAPSSNAGKVTPIVSAQSAIGYVAVPFSYAIATPNISNTVTYAIPPESAQLPAGLSLNGTTGVISGTPATGTAGTYSIAIQASNTAAGAVTGGCTLSLTIIPTGAVSREFLATTGSKVSNITVPISTTQTDTLMLVDDDTDYPSNTGERLRGYIVPPKTGNYYFYLAANNAAELWISNDNQYVNKVRRAYVTASTGKLTWNTQASQQSQWINLVAGQSYYFEVLHNTGGDADTYVELGWCQDDLGTVIAVPGAPNATGATTMIPAGGGALQGYPLSGEAPSYLFQPYDYPVVDAVSGAIYSADLGPQGATVTQATGSGNLRVDPSNTSAILHFNYTGLSSPRTAYHLHIDGFTDSGGVVHPQGEIIYDIDQVDSFHPELKTADGGYIYNFGAVGSFSTAAQIYEAVKNGKVYLNIHTVTYPGGEIRGNMTFVTGSQTPPQASAYPDPGTTDDYTTDAGAARFLNQASFGASPADIAYVKANGFAAWINNQLTLPATTTSNDVVAGITADINQPYPSSLFTNTWWKYSITAPDQLRQRVAFAMSEIMVVSWANDTGPLATNGRILANYYDTLINNILPTSGVANSGSFQGMLKSVTLTPAMGLYLNMQGNQKGDNSLGRHPNENYAREIMQLFSVGIYRLWDDGKFVLDNNASLPATYNQSTILGMAALMTGWNYAQSLQASGRLPTNFSPAADYLDPMLLVPAQHDLGAKLLLNNVMTPAATGLLPRLAITGIAVGNPCTVTTASNHGMQTGDTVAIYGVGNGGFPGGTFSAINTTFNATVTGPNTFTVPVNCTGVSSGSGGITGPTVTGVNSLSYSISSITATNPCKITTSANTLRTGDYVTISGVTGGTFPGGLTTINSAFPVTVTSSTTFTIPVSCTVAAGSGGTAVNLLGTSGFGTAGFPAVPGSQADNNGSTLPHPYDQYGLNELDTAISNIVNNDNVPPYVCRQLIQRLVTSDPSPGYLFRVVQKFKDDGTGVRGNLAAVVTQILLDGEARSYSSAYSNAKFGKQREPVLRLTGPARAFPASPYSGTYTQLSGTDSNKLRITTAGLNPFNAGFSVSLDFSGNYTSKKPPTPYANPTSTTYNVAATLGVISASTDIATVGNGSPTTITTVQPHGLTSGNTVSMTAICAAGGTSTANLDTQGLVATVIDANTYTVPVNTSALFQVASINTGNPCTITTTAAHGLTNGVKVTLNGIVGGTFSSAINSTFTATVTSATTFTVPSNCTVAPTSFSTLQRLVSNPCRVTTVLPHNLTTGASVSITGITGGTFSPSIDGSFTATVVDSTSFTVPVNATVAATGFTGAQLAGSQLLDVLDPGILNVTYAQLAGSNVLTVNTTGPTTGATVPGGTTTTSINSRVYLKFLSQTSTGGASVPADGIYDVTANTSGTTFTVATSDTPATARAGNVMIPKVASSYTPQSSNTVVQFNTNLNHYLHVGDHVWVDAPVVNTPLTDAEYAVTGIVDEDHFTTSYQPANTNSGTYPKPVNSNDGATLWPLVAPPTGRSGNVTIATSTYSLGSTESTLTQSPLNSPTVFNFFFPNYQYPGVLSANGLDSPEFQLTTDSGVAGLTNALTNMFIGTGGGNSNLNGLSSFNNGGGSVVMDISKYMTDTQVGSAGLSSLIDSLSNILIGGPLETNTKTAIQGFVGNTAYFPLGSPGTNLQRRDRVRAIIHLILTSAEYAVQK